MKRTLLPALLLVLSLSLAGCGASEEAIAQQSALSLSVTFDNISVRVLKKVYESYPSETAASALSGAYLSLASHLADAGKEEEAENKVEEGRALLPDDPALQAYELPQEGN